MSDDMWDALVDLDPALGEAMGLTDGCGVTPAEPVAERLPSDATGTLIDLLARHASFGWDGTDRFRCRCGEPLTQPKASWVNAEPHWLRHVADALTTPPTDHAAAPTSERGA